MAERDSLSRVAKCYARFPPEPRAFAGTCRRFAGNQKTAWSIRRASAGTQRLLAGRLQIVVTRCGTLVFKEAQEVVASSHR
jgi:hypothetical protein